MQPTDSRLGLAHSERRWPARSLLPGASVRGLWGTGTVILVRCSPALLGLQGREVMPSYIPSGRVWPWGCREVLILFLCLCARTLETERCLHPMSGVAFCPAFWCQHCLTMRESFTKGVSENELPPHFSPCENQHLNILSPFSRDSFLSMQEKKISPVGNWFIVILFCKFIFLYL